MSLDELFESGDGGEIVQIESVASRLVNSRAPFVAIL